MRKLLFVCLLLLVPNVYADVQIGGNIEDGKDLIYGMNPDICTAKQTIQYTRSDETRNGVLLIETIICGDSIFANGFD